MNDRNRAFQNLTYLADVLSLSSCPAKLKKQYEQQNKHSVAPNLLLERMHKKIQYIFRYEWQDTIHRVQANEGEEKKAGEPFPTQDY